MQVEASATLPSSAQPLPSAEDGEDGDGVGMEGNEALHELASLARLRLAEESKRRASPALSCLDFALFCLSSFRRRHLKDYSEKLADREKTTQAMPVDKFPGLRGALSSEAASHAAPALPPQSIRGTRSERKRSKSVWGAAIAGASTQLVEAPALGIGAGCSGYAPPVAATFGSGIGGIGPTGPTAQKRSRIEFIDHAAAVAVVRDPKSTDAHVAAALYSIAISKCDASVAANFDAPAVDAVYNAGLQCAQDVGFTGFHLCDFTFVQNYAAD